MFGIKHFYWAIYSILYLIIPWAIPYFTPETCGDVKCKNGGTCADDGDTFKCLCPSGYKGRYCEQGLSVYFIHCEVFLDCQGSKF